MQVNDDRPSAPHPRQRPSLFWPIVLIGVGVVWLLSNLDLISAHSLYGLWRLWPMLLIVAGLDLLLGHRWPAVGGLIGLGVVVLVVVALLNPLLFGLPTEEGDWPTFWGLPTGALRRGELRTQHLSEPLGEATVARVTLDMRMGNGTVDALAESSSDLLTADVTQRGDVDLNARGAKERVVTLRDARFSSIGWWGDWMGDQERWDVRLTRRVPLELEMRGSAYRGTYNLSQLKLKSLELALGSGRTETKLPGGGPSYNARIAGGSGRVHVAVPDDAELELMLTGGSGGCDVTLGNAQVRAEIRGGSGRVTVDVPRDAALRIEVVREGSGKVRLPGGLTRVSEGRGEAGTWETRNFAQAKRQITLILSGGSGGITIQ